MTARHFAATPELPANDRDVAPLDILGVPLSGTQLIEASAGTGKTFTIATLFVRLVLERKLDVDQILVVTFTNAATAELRDRVRKRLREALLAFEEGPASPDPLLRALVERSKHRDADRGRLTRALGAIDEAAIHTIHGFSQRVLREHAFEGGVRPELHLLSDVRPLVAEIVDDFWNEHIEDAPRAAVEYLRKRNTGSKDLTLLGLLAVRTPDAPIVIETGPVDLDGPLAAYFESRRRAAEAWRQSREQVRTLLVKTVALNRARYKPEDRETLVECMDEFVSAGDDTITGFSEQIPKFSQERLRQSTNQNQVTPIHPFFALCDDVVRTRADVESALERWAQSLEFEFVKYVRAELPLRTAALSSLSFDDLLLGLRQALSGPRAKALVAALRRRFPAALIDEFHDTDPVQYEIFRRVYSGRAATLFLIGDPKQAIYAFRGADVFAYLSAVEKADGRYTLDTNHRSDPTLVRGVNTVFSRAPNPFLFEAIRFQPVRARGGAADGLVLGGTPWSGLEFVHVPRTPPAGEKRRALAPGSERAAAIAAAEIARMLHARPQLRKGASTAVRDISPGDFAVLTRSNRDCHDLQRELRSLGIPSVLHGDSSVLETEEAEQMKLILAALSDPASGTNVRSALSTNLFGLGASDLFGLGDDEGEWEKWTALFQRWHELFKARGFLQAIRALFTDCGVPERVLSRVGGERTLTNYLHLTELCHRAAVDLHLGMAGLVAWFDDVRFNDENKVGLAAEVAQVRLESDDRAVQLTTMHRSKGLEYPFVVLPYLWRSGLPWDSEKKRLRYHDPKNGHGLVLDLRPTERKPEALEYGELESLAENVRLAYVALTRAKHRCLVLWGSFYKFEESALARLLHAERAAVGDLKQATDAGIRADLDALAAASDGSITVREWVDEPSSRYRFEHERPHELAARERSRLLSGAYRTSSFSALTAVERPESPLDDGRDVDEETAAGAVELAPVDEPPVPLSAFPRGPRAGDVLHAILEDADFEQRDAGELERLSRQHLTRQGFDAALWAEPVARSLREVLDTPLLAGDASLRLNTVSLARRRSEMEFTFPTGGGRGGLLTPQRLGRVLQAREGGPIPRGYGESVARLGFSPLAGFLRGFVDLIFEHGGRHYVVDYKSNHLGAGASSYRAQLLAAPMAHHHYFLQYHVYLVALHRHLSTRLAGYTYERHMGGVLYLFLRGMAKDRGPATGVFFDRPDAAVVEELSRVIGGGGRKAQ